MRYTTVDGLWHFVYTYTNTTTSWTATSAAHDTTPDFTTFTNVSTQTAGGGNLYEGTCWILVSRAEGWWVGQTNYAGGMQALNPANLNATPTTINAPAAVTTLEPHPNITPVPYTNGGTEFLLCVWAGTALTTSVFGVGSSQFTNDYGNVAAAKVFDWGTQANVYSQGQLPKFPLRARGRF